MNNIQLIKRISPTQQLITFNNKYFIVSETNRLGYETLVFPANAKGKIESFLDVAGGPKMTPDEVIEQMRLNGIRSWQT
jgi:hypothetical protein